MTEHLRNKIREYVRAQLQAIAGLENSVLVDSEEVPEDVEAPIAVVDLGDEDIQTTGLGDRLNGRKRDREMQMNTDVICSAKREPKQLAESYIADIEAKLSRDPRMGGLIRDLRLRALTKFRSPEGSRPTAMLRLQWFVSYSTYERDSTVPA
jgi:hypothetical protein